MKFSKTAKVTPKAKVTPYYGTYYPEMKNEKGGICVEIDPGINHMKLLNKRLLLEGSPTFPNIPQRIGESLEMSGTMLGNVG